VLEEDEFAARTQNPIPRIASTTPVIVQSVNVLTTVSIELSSRGLLSPEDLETQHSLRFGAVPALQAESSPDSVRVRRSCSLLQDRNG
jgi:hypothetical protein